MTQPRFPLGYLVFAKCLLFVFFSERGFARVFRWFQLDKKDQALAAAEAAKQTSQNTALVHRPLAGVCPILF